MAVVRLSKHQQGLLCEIWKTMPLAVRKQLTQESVRNVDISPGSMVEAVRILAKQRADTGCNARRRRLDTLLAALK